MEPANKIEKMAFDRSSVRSYDVAGRLHVSIANISKANVCPYFGSEIPNAEKLGLDASKIYNLYRAPEELEKAAQTSNNIQLLELHTPVSTLDPKKQSIVGSTGTDAMFVAPYLQNSLVVWDAGAIEKIETDEERELSCGYNYRADMTPGLADGVAYDGVMRDIIFNHIALVKQGRAGADVLVGDTQIGKIMPLNTTENDPERPDCAGKDSIFDQISAFLTGKVSPEDLAQVKQLCEAPAPVAAAPANPAPAAHAPANPADPTAKPADPTPPNHAEKPADPAAAPTDPLKKPEVPALKPAGAAPAAAAPAPTEKPAEPLPTDPAPTDQADVINQLKVLVDQLAGKSGAQDEPPEAAQVPGTPEPPTSSEPTNPNPMKKDDPMDKTAMDAAISAAIRDAEIKTINRMRDIASAEKIVRPYIGELSVAQDSADAVFKLALEAQGVDLQGVHPSAYRAMVGMLKMPGQPQVQKVMAKDSKNVLDFNKRFPDAKPIRQLG